MNNEKSIRAFLAIEPPAEIRKEIGNIQNNLKRLSPVNIRWVNPGGIHLTLKFFGNISETDIIAISGVTERNTQTLAPLHFEVKKLGLFPSQKSPRVLWIGLGGDTASLLTLQKNLEQGFEECGFTKEERPFRAHLTLGRIKVPDKTGAIAKIVGDGGDCTAGSFSASGLILFKSDLTPQGAIYTKLARFPFEG